MKIQRREFIQAGAAVAAVAAMPVLAAEAPPWQLGAIEDATRQIAGALNAKGIRTQALTQPADYLSKINGIEFDNDFYVSFRIKQEDVEDIQKRREQLSAVYLQPGSHSFYRGMFRVARARVLNEMVNLAELEPLLGGLAHDYEAGHAKEIEIALNGYKDWVDTQIVIANCRYGVIEACLQDGNGVQVLLDRPLQSPLNKGLLVRGGLSQECVRFNDGVRVVTAPPREGWSVTCNGVCVSYKIEDDYIQLNVLCGVVLDHLSKCSRYVGNGSHQYM